MFSQIFSFEDLCQIPDLLLCICEDTLTPNEDRLDYAVPSL